MADGRMLDEDSNFSEWQAKMMQQLHQKGIQDVITDDIHDSRKNEKAALLIIKNVSPKFLENLQPCKTAKEMMLKLESRFSQKTIFRKLHVRKQLLNLKCGRSETLQNHFVKFDSLISNLEDLGCTLNETDKIYHLLFTLLDKYEVVISSLENALWENTTTTSFDFVKSTLMDYEMILSEMSEEIDGNCSFLDAEDKKDVLEQCGDLTQLLDKNHSNDQAESTSNGEEVGRSQSNHDNRNQQINEGDLELGQLQSNGNAVEKSAEKKSELVTMPRENVIIQSQNKIILGNKILSKVDQIQNAQNIEKSEQNSGLVKTPTENLTEQPKNKNKIILGTKNVSKADQIQYVRLSTEQTETHSVIQNSKGIDKPQNNNNNSVENTSEQINTKMIEQCENLNAKPNSDNNISKEVSEHTQIKNDLTEIPNINSEQFQNESETDAETFEDSDGDIRSPENSRTDSENPCVFNASEQESLKLLNSHVLLHDVAKDQHCVECNIWFLTSDSITKHKETHEISQKTLSSPVSQSTDVGHRIIMRSKNSAGPKSSKTNSDINSAIKKVLSINTCQKNAEDIPNSPKYSTNDLESLAPTDKISVCQAQTDSDNFAKESDMLVDTTKLDEELSEDDMDPLVLSDENDCGDMVGNTTIPNLNVENDDDKTDAIKLNLCDSMMDIQDNPLDEQLLNPTEKVGAKEPCPTEKFGAKEPCPTEKVGEKGQYSSEKAIVVEPIKLNDIAQYSVKNELDYELPIVLEGSEIECHKIFFSELKLRDVFDDLLCSFCNKWFLTPQELKLHKKSHILQASLSSGSKTDLIMYAKKDAKKQSPPKNPRNYTCEICQSKLPCEKSLARHLNIHQQILKKSLVQLNNSIMSSTPNSSKREVSDSANSPASSIKQLKNTESSIKIRKMMGPKSKRESHIDNTKTSIKQKMMGPKSKRESQIDNTKTSIKQKMMGPKSKRESQSDNTKTSIKQKMMGPKSKRESQIDNTKTSIKQKMMGPKSKRESQSDNTKTSIKQKMMGPKSKRESHIDNTKTPIKKKMLGPKSKRDSHIENTKTYIKKMMGPKSKRESYKSRLSDNGQLLITKFLGPNREATDGSEVKTHAEKSVMSISREDTESEYCDDQLSTISEKSETADVHMEGEDVHMEGEDVHIMEGEDEDVIPG